MEVPLFAFEELKGFPCLVHGTSFRFFLDEDGNENPLYLGRQDQTGVQREHVDAFCRALEAGGEALYLPKQVHGKQVHLVEEAFPAVGDGIKEADAVITCIANRPIGVMTADCLPVLVFDPETPAIGVVHAGRKGTSLRIVSRTIAKMEEAFGCRASSLRVALGPAIGGCCYEVGDECLEAFAEEYPQYRNYIRPSAEGKVYLDLIQANRQDALDAGVDPAHVLVSGECTACNIERWYSYRKEGTTGRMVTAAMLR